MKDSEDYDLPCGPILYVLVVGFHHKKGCLIEYCFPPMRHTNSSDQREGDDIEGDGIQDCSSTTSTSKQENIKVPFRLPKVWRTLPSIALPDGAHNYDRDTIYFHLPHPERPLSTIYGISCYRQISSDRLHRKTDDVTRETVQKSVVVLSELPLYGLIAAKCEMITYAYFNEFDFSKVDCLKELYNNLNGLLTKDYLNSSEVFLGLSPRDLIATFQHKILILFKLLLLEKKVLFYKSPVQDLCTIILTLLSLFPGMIEEGGLDYSSTSVVPKPSIGRKFSGDIELLDPLIQEIDAKEKEASNFASRMRRKQSDACNNTLDNNTSVKDDELSMDVDGGADATMLKEETNKTEKQVVNDIVNQDTPDEVIDTEIKSVEKSEESNNEDDGNGDGTKKNEDIEDEEKNDELNISAEDIEKVEKLAYDENNEDVNSQDIRSSTPPLLKLPLSECGLPLRIFGNGSFCHPYLSITYLDILSDPRVRSCVVGATNFLFKQKKNLFDIIIEVDGGKIEISDPELRKKVALSTEDLRFADFLVKAALEGQVVNKNSTVQNVPNDGSSWEGCDDWLRYQFKIYLLHLLRTSQCEENSKEYASFNSLFLSSWKETYNYRLWSSLSKPRIFEVNPGHPFHGQLSIADMKLKLSQAFSNTERGKKLNQTLGQTSKAVGGALSSAKTAVSSWWSSQWNTSNRTRENNSPPTSLTPSYSLTGLLKSLDNKNPPTSMELESEAKLKDDVEEI